MANSKAGAAPGPRRLRLVWAIGAVVLLVLGLAAFFFPFLLKRFIEKHSVEWIGRRVTIDRIVLNPFTFTYAVKGVTCYEPGSDEVFVSWRNIAVKSDLIDGFRNNHWRFRKLRIIDPYVHVAQQGDRFNFSDLLEMGSDGPTDTTATEPVQFSLEDIELSGGRIVYASDILKAPVAISGLQATCNRITSESARMDFDLGLSIDGGGRLDGGFEIDTERSLYAVRAELKEFTLAQLLPYLQDFMHTTTLQGQLDLGLDLADSWADTSALAVSGNLSLDGFGITDGEGAPLITMRQGQVVLDTLNARTQSFKLSRMAIDGLATRFQQWPDGSNTWTKVLKLDSTTTGDSTTTALAAAPSNIFVMLADYIRMLGQEFVASQYTADSLLLTDGAVEFEDFTPEKPFRYTLDRMDIRSSRITTAAGTADFTASARLNQRGMLTSTFRFDPKDFRNVAATLEVKDLSLPDLDAYSRWYAAHPITSGLLAYQGTTTIQNGKLDSQNHLAADNLRFGKKVAVHDTGIYILPLRLGTALLRDVNGRIDLDIPVTGDLNDPQFKPWPIVWKVLKNLVVKAAAAPVKLVGGLVGGQEEGGSVEEVRFASLSAALGKEQQRPLDALAALLKEKPELGAALVSVTDMREQAGEWAAKRMKMAFLGLAAPLAKEDSLRVEGLSLRDSSFTAFLNGRAPGTAGQPGRQRCLAAVGQEAAMQAVEATEQQRQEAVRQYLAKAGIAPGRIIFRNGTEEELAGFIGAPGFRFVVDVGE